jgi:hypothetical protein
MDILLGLTKPFAMVQPRYVNFTYELMQLYNAFEPFSSPSGGDSKGAKGIPAVMSFRDYSAYI